MVSRKSALKLFSISLLLVLLFITAYDAPAATNGQIYFNGTVLVQGATCATSRLQIVQGWNATTSDIVLGGQAQDFTAYVVKDAAGLPIATGVFGIPVGASFTFNDSVDLNSINAISKRPLTISLYDIIGDPTPIGIMVGAARAAAIEALPFLASSTFDPASVLAVCANVPIQSQSSSAPSAPVPVVNRPGPDMVALPSGAAMGLFVADTPAYWAPQEGALTSVTLKSGMTLWVLGMDASGQFYHVVFAGVHLWVPVGTMVSNSDGVWHNTILPATVQ